jgi:hypothetical protein
MGNDRVPKDIAATPYRPDVMTTAGCLGEVFAQLANKDIDDLEFGFLYPAVEMLEKHLLGYDGALMQAEQLENAILLSSQVHRPVVDRDILGVQVHHQIARSDCARSMSGARMRQEFRPGDRNPFPGN